MVRRTCLWGVALAVAVTPFFGWAAEFSASIKGRQVQWLSLSSVTEGQAPSYWDIPLNLPAARTVIPGGVTNTEAQRITVSFGSKAVQLPITIKGMSYRVSSVASEATIPGSSKTTRAGNEVFVTGNGIGDKAVTLNALESPITHYRPYLSTIDSAVWDLAFKNANAPKGRYQGTLPVTALYDYIRDGVRIRYTLVFSLTVKVDYTPQFLHEITVAGNDAMILEYHYPLKVSGRTSYEVTASGYFADGVWVGLVGPDSGEHFSLKSATTDKAIKYSVICRQGCVGDNRIIANGQPIINTTTKRARIEASEVERARATLEVSFDPISELEFKGDTYTGKFTLLFEARI